MTKQTTNTLLRTPETWARYQSAKKEEGYFICNRLKTAPIIEFGHFAVIENKYPYDAVAETHHMLVPKNHNLTAMSCTVDELEDYWRVCKILGEAGLYDSMLENFPSAQSHPPHWHLHLLRWIRI